MISPSLRSASTLLRGWMIDYALPFWAGPGFDHQHGRFEERLSLQGERVLDTPLRLMVQARQIYVYALAARRKWHDGAQALAEQAYASMVRDFYRRGGRDGWVHSIARDGAIADPQHDLYGHAFALLAVASYVQLTGKREALALADETLAFLDAKLRAVKGGGYVEALPISDRPRRQNPHMHLFEALLALSSSSGDGRYLAKVGELFELFTSRFFRADAGTLGEYFDASLEPAAGVAGSIVEPGHHYEWIWLLRSFERQCGRAVQPYVDALYVHADGHGYDNAGLIVDETLIDGSHRTPTRRIWPATEAIKANLAEARLGRKNSATKAASLARMLHTHFLSRSLLGGWTDRLDANGAVATDFMPASTFYHIACAIDELDRYASQSSPQDEARNANEGF